MTTPQGKIEAAIAAYDKLVVAGVKNGKWSRIAAFDAALEAAAEWDREHLSEIVTDAMVHVAWIEPKWTPGPWFVSDDDGWDELRINSRERDESNIVEIATVAIGFDGPVGIEQDANARLISAAPELAELAADLAEWHSHNTAPYRDDFLNGDADETPGRNGHEEIEALGERAAALYAKARGEGGEE